jgi:hypothetical protein
MVNTKFFKSLPFGLNFCPTFSLFLSYLVFNCRFECWCLIELIVHILIYMWQGNSDTSAVESGSDVDELGSPIVRRPLEQSRLAPVREEVICVDFSSFFSLLYLMKEPQNYGFDNLGTTGVKISVLNN